MALAAQRKLPFETLAEIFQHCVPSDTKVLLFKPFTAQLDLVCSRWRQVALGTPSLWAHIHVDYGEWKDYAHLTKLARLRFSRSSAALITLTIEGDFGMTPGDRHGRVIPDFVVDLVMPNLGRLKCVSIMAPDSLLTPLLALSSSSVPFMESVTLSFHGNYPVTNTVLLSTAPSLRRVTINSSFHLIGLHLPWDQLTELCLSTRVDPRIAADLLCHCKALMRCEIQIGNTGISIQSNVERTSSMKVTPLLSLLSLVIHLHGTPSLERFLKRLTLPHLTCFRVLDPAHGRQLRSVFMPIISHSYCLQTLNISSKIGSDDIDILLPCILSVVNLHLTGGDPFSHETLQKFSLGEILPKLGSLGCFVDNMDLFVGMLECRRRSESESAPHAVLKSVDIYATARSFSLQARTRVDNLRTEGLAVTLKRLFR